MKTHMNLKELFLKNADIEHVTSKNNKVYIMKAMSFDAFVRVFENNLALGKPEPLAKNKDCDVDFEEWQDMDRTYTNNERQLDTRIDYTDERG